MESKNSEQKQNSEPTTVFNNGAKIQLDPHVEEHINKSVKGSAEKTAKEYATLAFSACSLLILGMIFNSMWGLNERSSRNEGRLMEFSSYIEMLKFQNKALESENAFLKKQRICLIEKKENYY